MVCDGTYGVFAQVFWCDDRPRAYRATIEVLDYTGPVLDGITLLRDGSNALHWQTGDDGMLAPTGPCTLTMRLKHGDAITRQQLAELSTYPPGFVRVKLDSGVNEGTYPDREFGGYTVPSRTSYPLGDCDPDAGIALTFTGGMGLLDSRDWLCTDDFWRLAVLASRFLRFELDDPGGTGLLQGSEKFEVAWRPWVPDSHKIDQVSDPLDRLVLSLDFWEDLGTEGMGVFEKVWRIASAFNSRIYQSGGLWYLTQPSAFGRSPAHPTPLQSRPGFTDSWEYPGGTHSQRDAAIDTREWRVEACATGTASPSVAQVRAGYTPTPADGDLTSWANAYDWNFLAGATNFWNPLILPRLKLDEANNFKLQIHGFASDAGGNPVDPDVVSLRCVFPLGSPDRHLLYIHYAADTTRTGSDLPGSFITPAPCGITPDAGTLLLKEGMTIRSENGSTITLDQDLHMGDTDIYGNLSGTVVDNEEFRIYFWASVAGSFSCSIPGLFWEDASTGWGSAGNVFDIEAMGIEWGGLPVAPCGDYLSIGIETSSGLVALTNLGEVTLNVTRGGQVQTSLGQAATAANAGAVIDLEPAIMGDGPVASASTWSGQTNQETNDSRSALFVRQSSGMAVEPTRNADNPSFEGASWISGYYQPGDAPGDPTDRAAHVIEAPGLDAIRSEDAVRMLTDADGQAKTILAQTFTPPRDEQLRASDMPLVWVPAYVLDPYSADDTTIRLTQRPTDYAQRNHNMLMGTELTFQGWDNVAGEGITLTQGIIVPEWGANGGTKTEDFATRILGNGNGGAGVKYQSPVLGQADDTKEGIIHLRNDGATDVTFRMESSGPFPSVAVLPPGFNGLVKVMGDTQRLNFEVPNAVDIMDVVAWRPVFREVGPGQPDQPVLEAVINGEPQLRSTIGPIFRDPDGYTIQLEEGFTVSMQPGDCIRVAQLMWWTDLKWDLEKGDVNFQGHGVVPNDDMIVLNCEHYE